MTALIDLPSIAIIILFVLFFLLMVINEATLIFTYVRISDPKFRGFRFVNMILVIAICFSILQITSGLAIYLARDMWISRALEFLFNMPSELYFLMLIMITGYTVYSIIDIRKWWINNLSSSAIKESMDALPEGLCYYSADGRPYFLNNMMNNISMTLRGKTITNVREFLSGVRHGHIIPKDKIIHTENNMFIVDSGNGVFSFRDTTLRDEEGSFHELKVADITEEYTKIRELEKKQQDLKEQQEYLKQLGETITQVTIEREILAAKIRVHDKLGESLIAAKRYLLTGDGNPDAIKTLWTDNLALLAQSTTQAGVQEREDPLTPILKASEDIGINVVIDGELPEEDRQVKILANALHECVTNTIRHAGGDTVNVSIERRGEKISFTNNGKAPEGKINENGGLRNLRNDAEKSGYKMMIVSAPEFKLILVDKNRSIEGE